MNDIERIDRMISILRDMKKDIIRQQKLCSLTIWKVETAYLPCLDPYAKMRRITRHDLVSENVTTARE